MRPAAHCRTRVTGYSLKILPTEHFINWQQDPHGNWQARLVFPEKAREFKIEIDLLAEMAVFNPFDFFVEPYAEEFPFVYKAELATELAAYLEIEPAGAPLDDYVNAISREKRRTIDFLVDLNAQLQKDIRYVIRMEPGVQTPEETLTPRSGSCRDSAWLLVQILRRLGFAARFVSGYLIQLKPDVDPIEGPDGHGYRFHRFARLGGGLHPGRRLDRPRRRPAYFLRRRPYSTCGAPHYRSCAPPISGVVDPANVEFDFVMRVERIRETPRVTKPYDDETWNAIVNTGHAVDERLATGDVRLSMGGEPTFVAADDMEGAEWNTAAVGPTKRRYADDLIRRLRAALPGGPCCITVRANGIPVNSLPRWAFALYWRKDGKPIWENQDLIVSESVARPATSEDADKLMRGLLRARGDARRRQGLCHPRLRRSRALDAEGGAATDQRRSGEPTRLKDPAERARMARVFDRGLGAVASYVLPIQAWQTADRGRRWVTERWSLRRGRLFLSPGDSPVGLASTAKLPRSR
ncbi:transglutaminase family protein [Methylocystis parvus]|uniref:transglutaminase family protein n=1 Tax=Methylocystis parvus TaxID=134 RepID=UPI003C735BEF